LLIILQNKKEVFLFSSLCKFIKAFGKKRTLTKKPNEKTRYQAYLVTATLGIFHLLFS